MRTRTLVVAVTMALVAAGCGSDDDGGDAATGDRGDASTDASDGGGDEAGTDDGASSATAPPAATAAGASGGGGGGDGGRGERVPETEELTADTDDGASVAPPEPQQSPALNAGWVDDNVAFDEYLTFLSQSAIEGVSRVDVSDRRVITVLDANERPVAGAEVVLRRGDTELHRGRTHADGRMFAFPGADGDVQARLEAVVRANGETVTAGLNGAAELTVSLDGARRAVDELDVLFLIDATGSMSDEIDRLKANIATVADRIDAGGSQVDLRFGMVTYRDHDDEYLTRTTDFTAELGAFGAELDQVRADGGGDNPEALDEALHEAVNGVSWRTDSIGLVFLVADAPPHLDDPQNEFDYADAALTANGAGIKVFPVASSGLDPAGAYVFRQIAQLTGAPFVFLTYGADGGPGTERPEFGLDQYDVLALDDLIVRLVTEELDHQR